jgi:carbonic anhydrase
MLVRAHRSAVVSRRSILQTAGYGLGLASMNSLLWPTEASGEDQPVGRRPETPDDVLVALTEGNKRFVRGEVMAPNRNMARLKEVAALQSPFAVFLGCADSRDRKSVV